MTDPEINWPVTILTGFLGAGKTTFLNHYIQKRGETRFAIIENEFGEQGIDNDLIIKPDETIVELNNGCLCCSLNDNLYDILNELYERRDDFDEIIIEATGVADPTGLAQPFITHPLLKKHFPLSSIICLADAELIDDHLVNTEEAKQQIAYSDIIIINKIDLIEADQVDGLSNRLREFNPLATILHGHRGDYPEINSQRSSDKLDKMLLQAQGEEGMTAEELVFPIEKPHSHHHHHHTDGINSQTFTFDRPFSQRKLNLNLSVFLTFQSQSLYRMKGLIWLDGESHKFVLQSVGKRFDFSSNKAWTSEEDKKSVIVFIGKNIQRKGIEKMLTRCLADT